MPYLTAAEVKTRRPAIADTDDADIEDLVSQFEAIAERYIGVAFLERSATYVGTPHRGVLELPHPEVSAITSLEDENGTAVTYGTLHVSRGAVEVDSTSLLTCVYTHGHAAPTATIASACARWVERMIVVDRSGASRDTLSQSFDGGTTRYSTPDWSAGRPTGFLQVDNDLNTERSRLVRVW